VIGLRVASREHLSALSGTCQLTRRIGGNGISSVYPGACRAIPDHIDEEIEVGQASIFCPSTEAFYSVEAIFQ
jgi:hypothetical protein